MSVKYENRPGSRKSEIKSAYRSLGKAHSFYDGMITGSTRLGMAVVKMVGTGVLSMPVWKTLPDAEITCLDYSEKMMVAASVWSLIIPAIEQSGRMGKLSFLPAFIGFWLGILFLLILDNITPHLHLNSDKTEGPASHLARTTMMALDVALG